MTYPPPNPNPPDAEAFETLEDVGGLLASSVPESTGPLFVLPPLGLLLLGGSLAAATLLPVGVGTPLAAGLLVGSIACTLAIARIASKARDEQKRVREAVELTTLRRWPEAAAAVTTLLARPMRLTFNRRAAVMAYAHVLTRYGRFDAAAEAADAVAGDPGADPPTRFTAGCGGAFALLRAGRLGDANGMLDGLRSDVRRDRNAASRARRFAEQDDDASDSSAPSADAALADLPAEALLDDAPPRARAVPAPEAEPARLLLVEMYRDVQTNHHAEVLDTFRVHRRSLADQLGLRLGDVLALASVAAHAQGDGASAGRWWRDATCLVPPVDLVRRYPEASRVASSYAAFPGTEGGEA